MTKSLTNFDITINSQKVPRLQGSKYFPFCGTMIDTETLDIIKDFTRLEGSSINSPEIHSNIDVMDSMTVERVQTPGKAFIVKTLKYSLSELG
jgi:telomerase reverse transcriptase